MILTDKDIKHAIGDGILEIEPFNAENLGSNSYDVTLAPKLLRFTGYIFDPYQDQRHYWETIDISEFGYVLRPNECYLACTNERTFSPRHVPNIIGKSSLGRNFLSIHQTAGFGDVGFNGYWTLELSVVQPVRIYPNMKIGQVYFQQTFGETGTDYTAKKSASYTSQKIEPVPVPSQMWCKKQ